MNEPSDRDSAEQTKRKRLKWEPGALMVLVLGLGMWLAFGPAGKPKFPVADDSITQEVRIGNRRGLLEARAQTLGADQYELRVWWLDEHARAMPPQTISSELAKQAFGANVLADMLSSRQNLLFRYAKITSWGNLVWISIGLLGQAAFSGRMILQWITSEKERKSVISESFWWFSLFGGVTLFSYFVWRQDPVGILGQASGVVVYARNIRLLRKQAARLMRDSRA
jgi:lipid-A-disaccharide synthase-like uncharacterized protein